MTKCENCWLGDFVILECDGMDDKLGCLKCGNIWTAVCGLDEDFPWHGNTATQAEEDLVKSLNKELAA
jgi:hypothetical protein